MSPSSTVFSTETYFHISCWDFCDQVYSFSFWGIGKVHSLSEHTFSDFCGGKHDLCWNAATLKALHLEAGLEPYNTFLLFAFENVFQREEGKILVAGIIHHSFVTAFAIVTPAGGSNNGALFPFRDPAQLFLSGLDIYQCFLFSLQRTLSQCPPVCLCI